MSFKTSDVLMSQAQQPVARRKEPVVTSAGQETTSSPGRTAARRSSGQEPSQSAVSTKRSSTSSEARELNTGINRRRQQKKNPRSLQKIRAFQFGVTRPTFKKTKLVTATAKGTIDLRNKRARSITIVPEYKKVKI